MTNNVEILYLFDQKDVDKKLENVKFIKSEEFELPQAVIAVFEKSGQATLYPFNPQEIHDNWYHYLKKRQRAVYRRQKRQGQQSKG